MAELNSIDLEPRHLKKIRSIFARHLPYKKVWAYGSRVKWTASNTSDLDCVVFGATDSEIANAREEFDESDIPFEVQLLDWDNIPEDFKENIKKGYFILRNDEDWGMFRLGDIADISSSKRIFYKEYVGNGVPFYRSKEIIEKHNKGKVSTDLHISEERYEEIKSKFGVPIQGNILLTSVGTLGIPYIVQEKEKFYFKDGNLIWLKNIKSDFLYYYFLYYWIVSPVGKNTLNSITIGSTQPALTISSLKEANISLPPISEQKAIASVLSSIDDKIDLLHRQNNTLESIAETIFRQWFIEETDDSWEEGVLGDAIQLFDSKRMPISKIQRDKMKDGNLFPYYGAATIMDYINNYIFDGEYILLGEDGTVRTNEGYPILQYATGKFWVNNHVHVIQAKSPYNNFFLWCYLSKKNIDKIVTGAVQPKVNQVNLKSLDFPKFPENLIEKFCFNTADIFSKIKHNQKQIKTLECLRNMLLPKLISGDIRVEYEEVS